MTYTLSNDCLVLTDTTKEPAVLTIVFSDGQRWTGTEKDLANVIDIGQYVIDQLKNRKR
jgi:hypothetical protein